MTERVDVGQVHRTAMTLADGRELVYFDEPRPTRTADPARLIDRRALPTTRLSSTMRLDRSLDEWVTIAQHRQTRTHLPPTDQCPLCPSTDTWLSEIPARDYDVVVFQNRFPAYTPGSVLSPEAVLPLSPDAGVLEVAAPGNGRCEVVCFTADHDTAFSALPPHRVRTVIEAWVDRTRALSAMPEVAQVFCFENRGEEIGVTLTHPHGQVYGYPFVTPRLRTMLRAAQAHQHATGRNLFADLLAEEIRDARRIVTRTEYWTAFVPFAARWPLEVHLYPNRQVPDLPALTDPERDELSHVYLDVLRRMEAVHEDSLPYIAAWHQAPVRVDRDLAYLHLEVFSTRRAPGKLKHLAGSESAMGAFINDVLPEQAAQSLREAAV